MGLIGFRRFGSCGRRGPVRSVRVWGGKDRLEIEVTRKALSGSGRVLLGKGRKALQLWLGLVRSDRVSCVRAGQRSGWYCSFGKVDSVRRGRESKAVEGGRFCYGSVRSALARQSRTAGPGYVWIGPAQQGKAVLARSVRSVGVGTGSVRQSWNGCWVKVYRAVGRQLTGGPKKPALSFSQKEKKHERQKRENSG